MAVRCVSKDYQLPHGVRRPKAHDWVCWGTDYRHDFATGEYVERWIFVCQHEMPWGGICGHEKTRPYAPLPLPVMPHGIGDCGDGTRKCDTCQAAVALFWQTYDMEEARMGRDVT